MEAKIKKSTVVYIFIFLFLSIAIWFLFDIKKNQNKQLYLNQKIIKAAAEFTATLNGYRMVVDFIENRYFTDPQILKIIFEGFKAQDKERYRKILYRKLKPLYADMKKYGINYLQIRFPDGTVFLSFHRPGKSKSTKSKPIIINLNQNKITGGFRFPFELYFRDHFLGNVEIAISYDSVKDQLRKIFKGEYRFLIHKKYLLNRLLSEERKSYIQSEINPDFFYESKVNRDYQINPEVFSQINIKLKEKTKNRLSEFKNFAVDIKVNGNYYVVSFIVISNTKGEKIGYLVYYEKDNTIFLFAETFLMMYGSVELALLAMLWFLISLITKSEKFKTLSEIDVLTGIYNKGKFNNVLDTELKKVRRYKRPMGLILFDIDHFKQINDTFGHQIGDYVLREIANIVKKNIRDTDIFARWGGEEFVLLAPETDLNGLKMLAEKLRKAIEEYNFEKVGKVTASFGITEATPEDSTDSVVKRADEALYLAKEKGRNRVEIILPEV